MYNNDLKKALEETFRERFDQMNAAEDPHHEFSPEFERKMKDLIRSAEKNKVVQEDDFKEVKPVKKKFVWLKWTAAAACLCIAAVGGTVLVRMINNPAVIPGNTDTSNESTNTSTSVNNELPEYIQRGSYDGGEALPTKDAYYVDENGEEWCHYDFAIVDEVFPQDTNGNRHDYFDNNEQSPNNFFNGEYSEDGVTDEIVYSNIPQTKLYVGDKFGGMTVTEASSDLKISTSENSDGLYYYFSKENVRFSVEGDLTLHGFLYYDPDQNIADFCADTSGLKEKLPYLPDSLIYKGGTIPPANTTQFWFTAASGYPIISLNADSDILPQNTGIYDVEITVSTMEFTGYGGDRRIKAKTDKISVNETKCEQQDGAEFPVKMPFDSVMIDTDMSKYDGEKFVYDYSAVRKLDSSELWYTTDKSEFGDLDKHPPFTKEPDDTILKVGDKVGNMTVTEAGMQLYALSNQLTINPDGYNRLTLEGEITITGTLSYNTENGYELCANPENFDTMLPYLPIGISGSSAAVDSNYESVAESGYPKIIIDDSEADMSKFEQDKTYSVSITANKISFNFNDNSSYSGIFITDFTEINVLD